jgi:hypothetical protein
MYEYYGWQDTLATINPEEVSQELTTPREYVTR